MSAEVPKEPPHKAPASAPKGPTPPTTLPGWKPQKESSTVEVPDVDMKAADDDEEVEEVGNLDYHVEASVHLFLAA